MDRDTARDEATAVAAALEFDGLRSERDARAIIAADLFEGAAQWDAKAERAAQDGHELLNAACRRRAASLRGCAHLLLERCP